MIELNKCNQSRMCNRRAMKKYVYAALLCVFLAGPVRADFTSKVTILEKAEISKISDDKLVDAYQDVLVELQAIKTFHTTSGFTPKQYDEYRNLLKYRLQLLTEIHIRNLEIPQQMEF